MKKESEAAKRGQKKQSISGQQQQREKEAGEAETGAGASKVHVSQSPHQKAAINPAKRVEVNDKLHFDSVANGMLTSVSNMKRRLKL